MAAMSRPRVSSFGDASPLQEALALDEFAKGSTESRGRDLGIANDLLSMPWTLRSNTISAVYDE